MCVVEVEVVEVKKQFCPKQLENNKFFNLNYLIIYLNFILSNLRLVSILFLLKDDLFENSGNVANVV